MSSPKPVQGVKSARNPSSIINEEHHDPTAAGKTGSGILASINRVIASSTVAEPVEDNAVLWVCNRSTSPQFIRTGKMSELTAAVDATNGMCIPPNFAGHVYCPESDDPQQAVGVKASHADVHITVMQS